MSEKCTDSSHQYFTSQTLHDADILKEITFQMVLVFRAYENKHKYML